MFEEPAADRVASGPIWAFPFALVPLALAVLAWSAALVRGGFAYDDTEAVFDNPVVRGDLPWWTAFTRDYWHHVSDAGHWRPAATLTLRLDHALWGDAALGYHATNLYLHLLVIALALAVARSLGGQHRRVLILGLCVLAAHPALADSVAWISGRTSMLSAIGGLAGLLLVARAGPRRTAAGLAAGAGLCLALSGKEDGLAFAPALVLVAARAGRRTAVAAALGVLAALGLWFAVRAYALGAALPSAPEAPLAAATILERAAVGGRALAEALRLVVLPFDYPPGWRVSALIPHSTGARLISGAAWFGLALFALAALRTLQRPSSSARLFGGASLCLSVAILPHLQLVPLGEALAPRFLYLPLLFGAPLLGSLLGRLPRAALAGLALTAVLLAWQRAGVYASREAYWSARLPHESDEPMVWNALGNARLLAGDRTGARRAWLEATARDPNYSRPWIGLARLALDEDDVLAAEEHLRRAAAAGPDNPLAWAGLGALYLRTDSYAEAAAAYGRATELAPGRAALWRGLARAHAARGDDEAARAAARRCLALDPGDAQARRLATGGE